MANAPTVDRSAIAPRSTGAIDAIVARLRPRHAPRHPHGRRRPARRRRARRAAHVDGREGRRPGRHAAHRQAGRGPGAVAERTADRGPDAPPRGAISSTRGRAAFEARFWNEQRGCLLDVVDVDHVPGTVDASFRPNQILAVGGLPIARARRAACAPRRRRRRSASADAARAAIARAGRARLRAALAGGVRASATPPIIRAPCGRG